MYLNRGLLSHACALALCLPFSAWAGSTSFAYTGTMQIFTVPAGVTTITIGAKGAQGGSVTQTCAATGGLGAHMVGDFAVTPGEVLAILVGQQGLSNGSDGGGGGGTFVVRQSSTAPLVVAGGGGGATNNVQNCGSNLNGMDASISNSGTASADGSIAGGAGGGGGGAGWGAGGGGGGFISDGTAGSSGPGGNGKSFLNGGAGGSVPFGTSGGYGGGGAGWQTGGNGGGGGGYSGGGSGGTNGPNPYTGGGGGGSLNAGDSQTNTPGVQAGNGEVSISWSELPGAPTGVIATAGNAQVSLAFTAPADNGGSPILSYSASCTPSGGGTAITAQGTINPIVVTSLTNGAAYNCEVTASNAVGPSAPSTSVVVTPQGVAPAPVQAPTAVPSLSEWSLMLLGLAAAGLGMRRLRRQQS